MSAIPIEQPELLSASDLRCLLLQYRKENWQGIQTPEWQERIVDDILHDDAVSTLRRLSDFWQMPTGALILDVGSGVGSFVVGCRRQGLSAFGIEPDRIGRGGRLTSIQIARRRLEGRIFASALGEKLPFPDRSFDLVAMNQVIEHVADHAAVLREALRVTREGGAHLHCLSQLPSLLRTALQDILASASPQDGRPLVLEITWPQPGLARPTHLHHQFSAASIV